MKTFTKKGLALLLTFALVVSILPMSLFSALAVEETDQPTDQPTANVGDTVVTKTDEAPQDVPYGVWVMKENISIIAPNPKTICGKTNHTHGDKCNYLSCEHYQRSAIGSPIHDTACYGNEENHWEVCPGGDHNHTASESGLSVYANEKLKSVWEPVYAYAENEWDQNHDVSEYTDTVVWGKVIVSAQSKYDTAKAAYALGVVKDTTYCYTATAPLTCGHGDACTDACCSTEVHTHIEGEDGCYEYTWVLKADENDNNIVDGEANDPYYTVTFTDGVDGTIFTNQEYQVVAKEGKLVKVPTFEGTPSREGYTLVPFVMPETLSAQNHTFEAQWTPNIYTITWDAGEGTFEGGLKQITSDGTYNTIPVAPATPNKVADAQYTYTFKGWTPEISLVTGEITYTAVYDNILNKYTVKWMNGGVLLETDMDVAYGTMPEYNGEDPTKDATAQFAYTFSGWLPVVDVVTGDVTYEAQFDATVRKYTVTWVNHDGSVLETDENVAYGTMPEYNGNAPEREDDEHHIYTFSGWSPEIVAVDGEIVYTAQFKAEDIIYYNVTFMNGDRVLQSSNLEEGTTPEYHGIIPTKDATAQFTYEFAGWDKEISAVTGDVVYNAVFTATVNKYEVTYDRDGDGVADGKPELVDYGTIIDLTNDIPTKEYYTFLGWSPASTFEVTGNVFVKASFKITNDANANNVPDELESFIITVKTEGNGIFTLSSKQEGIVIKDLGEGKFAVIFDSTKEILTSVDMGIVATPDAEHYLVGIFEKGELITDGAFTAVNGTEILVSFKQEMSSIDKNGFTPSEEKGWSDYIIETINPLPELGENVSVTVYYLAREAGKVPTTINLVDIKKELSFIGGMLPDVITVDVPVSELWINVDEEFTIPEQPTPEQIKEIIKNLPMTLDASGSSLVERFKNALVEALKNNPEVADYYKYIGAHAFGAEDEEKIYFEVKNGDQIVMSTIENPVELSMEDTREEVTITLNTGVEVVYGQFTEKDLLSLLNPVILDANGKEVNGLVEIITANVEKLSVADEVVIEVEFKGNEQYKNAKASVAIKIKKAPSSLSIDNQIVKYGDKFNLPVVTSPNGIDTIQFILGVDVSNVNFDGEIKGIVGDIQLLLPENLQKMLSAMDVLLNQELGTNVSFSDGASIKLSELKKIANKLNDYAGSTEYADYISTLVTMLDSIPTDKADVEITLGGSLPTNIGVYLIGAVTADSNYETSFGVGALAIYPNGMKAELDWNLHDENYIVTRPLLTSGKFDAGASVISVAEGNVADAQNQLVELFFGVNADGTLVLEADQTKLNVGAYVEVAFIADFGNEMYYAKPIVRPIVVAAETLDVDFTDATGAVNNDRHFIFDNMPHSMNGVKVTYTQNGNGYKAGDVVTGGDLKIYYVGTQTNGKLVYSDKAPVHAGVYTVTAVYTLRDENGDITHVGVGSGVIAIEPAKSNIDVSNSVKEFDGVSINAGSLVNASSSVAGITPDVTIITAGIATDGTFSENGILALTENVNIDLPAYLDELFAKYNVLDGRRTIDKYTFVACLNAANETFNKVGLDLNVIDALIKALEQIPANASITFKNQSELELTAVGAHLIIAVVTDSDHYPSMDAGICFIHPGIEIGELVWANTIDGKIVDINKLTNNYLDAKYVGESNIDPTELYFGVNTETWEIVLTNEQPDSLGAFLEIAYVFDIDSQTYIAAPIIRGFKLVDVVEPEHICESVCPECGLCLNNTCAEEACSNKCQGHEKPGPDSPSCEHVPSEEFYHDYLQHWHECTLCGEIIDAEDHQYRYPLSITCAVCGYNHNYTYIHSVHTYSNDCDTTCNVCGETRTVAGHVYDNNCDKWCNECGAVRNTTHTYTNDEDESCNVCGAIRDVYKPEPEEPKETLSGGEIAGIVVGSGAVAGVGGFSLFWFVIRKKSLAELLAVVKKVFKK